MHTDLIDAVNWAIKSGIVDPKKIAIYGGSYGGYAALVGATFTPDIFCCAVDVVGPSNIVTLLKSIPPYWAPMLNIFKHRAGDPDTEKEFLESRSPLFRADRIKIPLLMAQGANDPRVKMAESEQIVAAVRKAGRKSNTSFLRMKAVVLPGRRTGSSSMRPARHSWPSTSAEEASLPKRPRKSNSDREKSQCENSSLHGCCQSRCL